MFSRPLLRVLRPVQSLGVRAAFALVARCWRRGSCRSAGCGSYCRVHGHRAERGDGSTVSLTPPSTRAPAHGDARAPRGRMSVAEARVFVVIASVAFVVRGAVAARAAALAGRARDRVLGTLAKRHTTHTQPLSGAAMAVAPVGGWIAAGGPARASRDPGCGSAPAAGFDTCRLWTWVDRREGLH